MPSTSQSGHSATSGIDTVIFDYGGVVADDYCEPFASELAELIGTDRLGIEALISESTEHGARYRTSDISRDVFWSEVRLRAGGKEFSATRAQRLWAQTYKPNPEMLHLLKMLREHLGLFVCLLSNMDKDRYEYTSCLLDWNLYVDRFIVSSDIKELKPSVHAFNCALRECGRSSSPQHVLFVDDRSQHLVAAERLGLLGYRFKNHETLISFLDGLPLVPRKR